MHISKRQRRLEAQKLMKKPETQFEQIDLGVVSFVPKGMTRAFRNNRYTVMIYDNAETTHGRAMQVLIQNHTDTPIVNHWRELQRIKNEIFGPETLAIEYFPPESELVDQHNIYWIFIFDDGVIPKLKKANNNE
jgi:hypothetical protein